MSAPSSSSTKLSGAPYDISADHLVEFLDPHLSLVLFKHNSRLGVYKDSNIRVCELDILLNNTHDITTSGKLLEIEEKAKEMPTEELKKYKELHSALVQKSTEKLEQLTIKSNNAVDMFNSKPLEDLRRELEYSTEERIKRYQVDNACLDSYYDYMKFQYDSGNYDVALNGLKNYVGILGELGQNASIRWSNALWGILAIYMIGLNLDDVILTYPVVVSEKENEDRDVDNDSVMSNNTSNEKGNNDEEETLNKDSSSTNNTITYKEYTSNELLSLTLDSFTKVRKAVDEMRERDSRLENTAPTSRSGRSVTTLHKLQMRSWLLHWACLAFLCKREAWDSLLDILTDKHFTRAIQTNCPWILRYLASLLILNKDKRQFNHVRKEVIEIVETSLHCYNEDPIIQLIECLYIRFDFDGAQDTLASCTAVLDQDPLLNPHKEVFIEEARHMIFETYCRIHTRIDITMLANKLGMESADAERWIVELIRGALLEAKIDSRENHVIMTGLQPSIYEKVIDKTKDLMRRSKYLSKLMLQATEDGPHSGHERGGHRGGRGGRGRGRGRGEGRGRGRGGDRSSKPSHSDGPGDSRDDRDFSKKSSLDKDYKVTTKSF